MKKLSLFIALLYSPLAFAQALSPFAPQNPTPTVTTTSTMVLIPALIKTKAGEPVFTLSARDFTVTDDGIPQKITLDENTGSEPIALVIALQTGHATAQQIQKYRDIGPFIESLIGSVPRHVALVTFDSQPTLRQSFTSDLAPVTETLHSLNAGDSADGAAILDTLSFSVNLLRGQPPEYRRAILLISETLDRGSQTALDQVLHVISDTNTAIYSIGYSTGKSEAAHYAHKELPTEPSVPNGSWLSLENHQPNPPHGCMGKDPDSKTAQNKLTQAYDCLTQLAPPLAFAKMAAIAATDGLQRNVPATVAQLTGGEYFSFSSQRTLEQRLATLSNHIPNRYMLSFHPQSFHPGLHSLSVRLKDYPSLIVLARSTYWAEMQPTTQPKP